MSEDIQIIHKVTLKLEETLHQINKMLSDHLKGKKPDQSKKSNEEKNNGDKSTKKNEKRDKKKRPLTPFFLFQKDQRDVIKQNYPDMSVTQVGENLGKIWKNLSEQDKKPYFEKSRLAFQKFYKENPEQKPNKKRNKD